MTNVISTRIFMKPYLIQILAHLNAKFVEKIVSPCKNLSKFQTAALV